MIVKSHIPLEKLAFDEPLHVGRPNIGDKAKFMAYVEGIVDRRWLTNNGPLVEEFEKRIAQMTGVRHCVAMCNATVALEIAIRALEMHGEVIVPSFTFVATAHALQWQGITPVFCDVEAGSHNIDPDRIEELITPRTTGIIGVHVWGEPCDLDRLQTIARRRNLRLLYDAAHAFGNSHQGRMIGGFGDAEVFSFHATKFLNTMEGGAVVTNDDQLAEKMRLMRNFGFASYDNVIYLGTNGKMNEVSAAMGLTNLDHLDEFIIWNLKNYRAYQNHLSDLPGLRLLPYCPNEKRNYQYVVVEVGPECPVSRDEFLETLWANNVLARRYFYPGVHCMEPYRSYYPHARLLLPRTEELVQQVLVLPTGTAVDPPIIQRICQLLQARLRQADAVTP